MLSSNCQNRPPRYPQRWWISMFTVSGNTMRAYTKRKGYFLNNDDSINRITSKTPDKILLLSEKPILKKSTALPSFPGNNNDRFAFRSSCDPTGNFVHPFSKRDHLLYPSVFCRRADINRRSPAATELYPEEHFLKVCGNAYTLTCDNNGRRC